jgi:hypothetical protein
VVNHSVFTFYGYDGRDCTGRRLIVFPRESGGVRAGWDDRLSSVEMCCPARTVAPADRPEGETLVRPSKGAR